MYKVLVICCLFNFVLLNSYSQIITLPGMETRWMTYVDGGSSPYFYPENLLIDKSGKPVVIGAISQEGNPNFISAGSFQAQPNISGLNALVFKLDTLGKLEWGTYFGFEGQVESSTLDKNDNIILGGVAYPFNYIPLPPIISSNAGLPYIDSNIVTDSYGNPYNTNSGDATLAKLSGNGSLQWATLVGGLGFDMITKVAVDSSGNIYALGITGSKENIATPGAFMQNLFTADIDYEDDQYEYYKGGTANFLMKFNAQGQKVWGTYLIHPDADSLGFLVEFSDIDIDLEGNLIISGITHKEVPGLISTNAFQSDYNCTDSCNTMVLIKFNANGAFDWGTYYGNDQIKIDYLYTVPNVTLIGTDIYLTSITSTPELASDGAYQETLRGNNDAFIAKFNSRGQRLWHTYFGGDALEALANNDMQLSKDSCLLLAGVTTSDQNFADTNSLYNNAKAYYNGFVAKFDLQGNKKWIYYTSPETTYTFSPGRSYLATNATGKLYHLRGQRSYDADPLPYTETVQYVPTNASIETNYLSLLVDTTADLISPIDTTIDTVPPIIDTPNIPIAIQVYPNPNNGNFTIEGTALAEINFDMVLFDEMGRRVIQKRLPQVVKQNFIFRKMLAAGTYILWLRSQDGAITKTFKILINSE